MKANRSRARGRRLLRSFAREDGGSTAIEYALIVSLIFLAIVAAVRGFASASNDMYSEIESALVE
jgi:pilus assembly protein Flp/PilA